MLSHQYTFSLLPLENKWPAQAFTRNLTLMEDMINDNIDIEWAQAREANLANWNERVAVHVEAYGLQKFKDEPAHISGVVAYGKPFIEPFLPGNSFNGLRVCHLQCHIGTDTLSMARLGATVTGVDFSQPALDAAAALTSELGLQARWFQGDVLEAATIVGETFDVVYTSIGTITWLSDLTAWASQVAQLLNDGGVFYIRDGHPTLFTLDEEKNPPVPAYRYFPNGLAQSWDSDETYAGDAKISSTRTYEYPHSLQEIFMSLINAGLKIEAFYEGDTLPWEFSKDMEVTETGDYVWPGALRAVIPCTFTIVATKPA